MASRENSGGFFSGLLHGADYNPDQWLHRPDIIKKDIELMKKAHINTVAVGIFSWAALEPAEGEYKFSWLDDIMDRLAENKINVVLATPSAARPAWLSQKYPEVLRVGADRKRILHGNRHNHCYTSPVYRKKTQKINKLLAERYGNHPALLVWHVSNEYLGECHCDLCQQAFRDWLKNKYGTLEQLNRVWWTAFWSHTYTDWDQIQSPAPHGEQSIQGLKLDWKRFVTDQTIDFFRNEAAPLRDITPGIPVTTNFMGTYPGLNYWKFARELDIVAWDSYPHWHHPDGNRKIAVKTAFIHDLYRSLKGGKSFMLMESTPGTTNWMEVGKRKKPGMHLLSALQAVAHGSDTVQYFQWRKGRGGSEKFHGAVVGHAGDDNNRVFRDVKEVGQILEQIDSLSGEVAKVEVGLVFDWENRWALEGAEGPREEMEYEETCIRHYRQFWERSIPVDILSQESDFSSYKLVIAPMLYMLREGVGDRIKNFVRNGGTLVTTYWSGIVDENDLCFTGGFPGPLREVLGIWSEEIDALYDGENNMMRIVNNVVLNPENSYSCRDLCALIHPEEARVLAEYGKDFYKGRPALTVNSYGKGRAYYLATRPEESFLKDLYTSIATDIDLNYDFEVELPRGVIARRRADYLFLFNFNRNEKRVKIPSGMVEIYSRQDKAGTGSKIGGFGVQIFKEK